MIYTALPVGSFHGWGVCGKYITKELSRLDDVKLITHDFSFDDIVDEFDFRLLKSLSVPESENLRIKNSRTVQVDNPVFQGIVGNSLAPMFPQLRGSINVGYTFFENDILEESSISNARGYFDIIVAGSKWCESVLRSHGLTRVGTIIQGIDPSIFNPSHTEKEYMKDCFIIFSGGKFELRKGQDIVIRAFKHMQDKHRDVFLINSWFNSWDFSINTMSKSPHITFSTVSGDCTAAISRALLDNGIRADRVITLPLYPNIMLPRIYENTDIGLFPNRCEGGTNLVLMEYMACGKPVIASYNSGHKDILTDRNSLILSDMRPTIIDSLAQKTAGWEEPSLDETIEKLEWAYQNRDELKVKAAQAGQDLRSRTWKQTARLFYDILKPGVESH